MSALQITFQGQSYYWLIGLFCLRISLFGVDQYNAVQICRQFVTKLQIFFNKLLYWAIYQIATIKLQWNFKKTLGLGSITIAHGLQVFFSPSVFFYCQLVSSWNFQLKHNIQHLGMFLSSIFVKKNVYLLR